MRKLVVDSSQVDATLKKLFRRSKKEDNGGVIVGYTQSYALYVHEVNREHRVGQWKYLQAAYMNKQAEVPGMVAAVYKKTQSVVQGLLIAGLAIQRLAQKLTPVDTGALKNSAYTAKEEEAQAKAARAFAKSEAIRIAGS